MSDVLEFPVRGWQAVIRFNDQSQSFTNGFECGQMFEAMSRRCVFERTIRTENIPQIESIAKYHNYTTVFGDHENGWTPMKAWP